jgi:hypothetical protein
MVQVKIKGQTINVDKLASGCYQIPSKKGEQILVAKVPAGTGKNGRTIYRFARVLDPSACPASPHILNRKVNKLVIGKREFPKLLRLASGATPKAPAFIPGKLIAAMAKKQAKKQK